MITVCGANVSLVDARRIPLIRPETAGNRWKGVSHGDALDALITEFQKREWEVQDQQFALAGSKDNPGSDLVGAFDLKLPGLDAPDGQAFSLGLMTSNALKRAMRIFVGTKIFVCNNGMATGEVVLARKHTLNFNVGDAIGPALDNYFIAAQKVGETVDRLKNRNLHISHAEHLILEAGRQGMLPWSRLSELDKQYREPPHKEHGRETSWTLLNAFTEVVKRSPVHAQMDSMNKFRDMLPLATAA